MKSATDLFDCFHCHLMNLDIINETHELFVAKVLEDYILNLGAEGITLGSFAEDIYMELQDEVLEMLQKMIYGHYNLDAFRESIRQSHQKSA